MAAELVDIDVVKRNLVYRIRRFEELENPGAPNDVYCDELCKLSIHQRQVGICLLLAEFDWSGFRAALSRSAEARVQLLASTRGHGSSFDRFICTGRNGPLFDAIASSRLDLAQQIAELSHAPYTQDYEYADDRAFALFIQALVASDLRPLPSHQRLLGDFLEATEGNGGARHAIGEALLEQDAGKLARGLGRLSEEHAAAYEEEAAGAIFDHFRFRTEQFVLVEGIALRALGDALGMKVEGPIRFMPDERD